MTKECTLKEAFIEKQLDEIQPDWKDGKDVTKDTKKKIQQHVQTKYKDILDKDNHCITTKSITNTITRIRKKRDVVAQSTNTETLPIQGALDKSLLFSHDDKTKLFLEFKMFHEKYNNDELMKSEIFTDNIDLFKLMIMNCKKEDFKEVVDETLNYVLELKIVEIKEEVKARNIPMFL